MKLQIDTCDLDGAFEELIDVTSSSPQKEQHQIYSIPTKCGTGRLQRILLRKGLELNWFDAKLHDPLTMDIVFTILIWKSRIPCRAKASGGIQARLRTIRRCIVAYLYSRGENARRIIPQ